MTIDEKLAQAAARGRGSVAKKGKKAPKKAKRKAKRARDNTMKMVVDRARKSKKKPEPIIKPGDLTERQKRFVQQYLIDCNGTQSAIRAGYSEKSASTQASEELRNPQVKAAIDAGQARLFAKLGITQERVALELARLCFSDLKDFCEVDSSGLRHWTPWDELPHGKTAAVSAIAVTELPGGGTKTEMKLWPKTSALKLLGQHLQMYVERKEISGSLELGSIVDAIKAAARAETDSD